ncbi:MAG: hypothetical protein KIT15_12295 [Xanthobacteraceae bacterium]|nr:hypothetical protein [Xanthobacteraceae bacterium]MCW5675348.1 hypothetical protein [Xanthobacteraceae bacterium]MCW5676609.1 hypothetical protein [Xanthobacteraceae bacterium]
MSLDAVTYFQHLKAYVNSKYVVHDGVSGSIVLKEKYFPEGAIRAQTRTVALGLSGIGLAFKLDHDQVELQRKRLKPALFHFLDDNAKPWSKRCDFVIFRVEGRGFFADCIEFKSKSLAADKIVPQLKAGVSWCRSLKHTIQHYTGDSRRIRIRKFAFGTNDNPGAYVNANGQLNADPSVRYYHFDDVNGRRLADLQNTSILEI